MLFIPSIYVCCTKTKTKYILFVLFIRIEYYDNIDSHIIDTNIVKFNIENNTFLTSI